MCSKEDFCDWSDIDLEELFSGDYTDDDVNNDSTGSSDSSVYEDELEKPDSSRQSQVAKRGNDGEYVFDCPVCRKILRSVTGFRGHCIKQHPSMDRSDFRGKLNRHLLLCAKLYDSWLREVG